MLLISFSSRARIIGIGKLTSKSSTFNSNVFLNDFMKFLWPNTLAKISKPTHSPPKNPSLIFQSLKAIWSQLIGTYLNRKQNASGISNKEYNCQSLLKQEAKLLCCFFACFTASLLSAVTADFLLLIKFPLPSAMTFSVFLLPSIAFARYFVNYHF